MASRKSRATALEPKRRRGRERVEGLLAAAAAVFAEKGYDAATMTEIAARAGAAIGSLYRFYPSKEVLADTLLARYGDHMLAGLDAIAAGKDGRDPAALADRLVALLLALRSERAAAVALLDARGDGNDRRAVLRAAMRRRIAAVLVEAGVPSTAADARAAVVMHLLRAVPVLAEEEEAGVGGAVDAARAVLRRAVAPDL
ncbi:TetR family transcriptional regulator [Azospirillum sp. ST 5-10]|uniref:TetR family transcriptional regulator n=1 Tax=unclassified Azospirillum TaxID=2630922 RepID=UPI003F4A8558